MQEIKCPKCGEVFQVDEAGYAAIVKQVRDKEFQRELAERQQQFLLDKENSVRLAQAEADNKLQDSLRAKDNTIANLYAKMKALEAKAELDKAGIKYQARVEDMTSISVHKSDMPRVSDIKNELVKTLNPEKQTNSAPKHKR